jgi:hypothetical protein
VEVVRRISINMSLLDALQVPTYSCDFKKILANKYEIATLRVDHVKMSEQCSAAIANGLEKEKDPGCPTIPCSVGSFKFEKALCDLGASVSVMPRDVFEKLRQPLEPTGMCLELGDNSIRYPLGIAEDVPVKVGHHFIPVDFVVLEMGEREKPPLIFRRPFLKTVGAIGRRGGYCRHGVFLARRPSLSLIPLDFSHYRSFFGSFLDRGFVARSDAMSQFICQQAELWGAVGALQAEVERKEAKLVSLRLSSAERLATVEEEKMTVATKLAEAQR